MEVQVGRQEKPWLVVRKSAETTRKLEQATKVSSNASLVATLAIMVVDAWKAFVMWSAISTIVIALVSIGA
jgi:hypothetical protein